MREHEIIPSATNRLWMGWTESNPANRVAMVTLGLGSVQAAYTILPLVFGSLFNYGILLISIGCWYLGLWPDVPRIADLAENATDITFVSPVANGIVRIMQKAGWANAERSSSVLKPAIFTSALAGVLYPYLKKSTEWLSNMLPKDDAESIQTLMRKLHKNMLSTNDIMKTMAMQDIFVIPIPKHKIRQLRDVEQMVEKRVSILYGRACTVILTDRDFVFISLDLAPYIHRALHRNIQGIADRRFTVVMLKVQILKRIQKQIGSHGNARVIMARRKVISAVKNMNLMSPHMYDNAQDSDIQDAFQRTFTQVCVPTFPLHKQVKVNDNSAIVTSFDEQACVGDNESNIEEMVKEAMKLCYVETGKYALILAIIMPLFFKSRKELTEIVRRARQRWG